MKSRKNIRRLIVDHNAAPGPTTALSRFVNAVVALKSAPSRLTGAHVQANRYDDYVYIHQQSMAEVPGHPMPVEGPHPGHRSPMFFPWHREFLRQFEMDLRTVSGDPDMCLPYWDFSRDRSAADPGYPFINACLGGNGTVTTGPFTVANGFSLAVGESGAIERDLGASAATLPAKSTITTALAETTYDAEPFNWGAAASESFRNLVEGWVGAEAPGVHNRVHVWVGGSMLPSTSPNDPVFFFNHCKEDELWAVWMQKHPTVAHYLPNDSYTVPAAQHHLKRLSDHMEHLSEYFGAGSIDRPIDLLDHKAITWYDTDLPDITVQSGPAIAWNQTPAGLTVSRTITLRVKSARTVNINVTGTPTGNFALVGGTTRTVTLAESEDFQDVQFEVRFTAVAGSPDVQVSAIDMEASILDSEGYYAAAEGDVFVCEKIHIELVANGIVTSDSSLVLVLDRSGSMSDVANSGFQKHELLKSAVGVVHELMKDTDEIGIARFDHEADTLLSMRTKATGLGNTLTGGGLDPRGSTSIGAGILVGSDLVNSPEATKPNKAMIVLTDGNENTDPLIAALPGGTINQTTFAIGFGLPGQVSDPILDQISANSGGYLLVTGDMTNDSERFDLAKFFIQILKDATLNDTIIDPDGQLFWGGQEQVIPFHVADVDVSVDVVVLCPVPVALDFTLETPSGRTIKPQDAGAIPNVAYVNGEAVCYYRLMLPALPSDAAGSHAGKWKAHISLKGMDQLKHDLEKLGDKKVDFKQVWATIVEYLKKPVPYNLSAYCYSNLRMETSLTRDSYEPGAEFTLTADLLEYSVQLKSTASVWADAMLPNGTTVRIKLVRGRAGIYSARWHTSTPGVYRFRVQAEGTTSKNTRFTRERLLSAGVWAGGDKPYDPKTGGRNGEDCHWIKCLMQHVAGSKELRGRLKEWGIDAEDLLKCMAARCAEPSTLRERGERKGDGKGTVDDKKLDKILERIAASGFQDPTPLKPAQSKAVVRRPRLKGSSDNMFIRPEDAKHLGVKSGKKK